MTTIKRSDISKEFRWVWLCPICEAYSDNYEDTDYEEEVTCEHCHKTFPVED